MHRNVAKFLDLLPADSDLSGATPPFSENQSLRNTRLRAAITYMADNYDYVLIDCLVRGLHCVAMKQREFMATLADVIREQALHHSSLMAFDGLLLHLCKRYDSTELTKRVVARCQVGLARRWEKDQKVK